MITENKNNESISEILPDLNFQQTFKVQVLSLMEKFFNWIIALVVVAVLILGYYLIINKQYQALVKSRDVDLVEVENTIAGLQHAVNSIVQDVDRSVEFTDAEEKLLALALPKQLLFPSLIVQLEAMAQTTGFWVETVAVNEPKTKIVDNSVDNTKLKKVNVDLVVVGGDYDRFKRFLTALENSIIAFDVIVVDFQDLGEGSFKYELSIVTYYYPY